MKRVGEKDPEPGEKARHCGFPRSTSPKALH
jgi:hypothetical protein